MNFALVGDHADGREMALALSATGRHTLARYTGPPLGADFLTRHGLQPESTRDLEEVLADPAIDLVIVAARPANRGVVLKRVLQSERHALCVHPVDGRPDVAFEAALIQSDTRQILLPLLPEAFHPGVSRFAELLAAAPSGGRVVEMDRWSTDEFLFDLEGDAARPGTPGWDMLRRVGGEIVEVFAMSRDETLEPGASVITAGRWLNGDLFRATYLAGQPQSRLRLALAGSRLELCFPEGWPGPSCLRHDGADGAGVVEEWPAWSPWVPMVEALEEALRRTPLKRAADRPGEASEPSWTHAEPRLGWTDATRGLELDDAIRRSIHYHRAYALDLQEASEETTFKGTMTLVGCAMMWIIIVLLFLSFWAPWLGWLIFPALAVFLGLQSLRWALRK